MRKRRAAMASINVVPYIDVMLVLLIIFMVTTPMMNQGIEVQLPRVTADEMSLEQELPIVVSLTQSGDYYFEMDGQSDVISLPELRDKVRLLVEDNPNRPVLVRADDQVGYGSVVRMITVLREAGVVRAGLLTELE